MANKKASFDAVEDLALLPGADDYSCTVHSAVWERMSKTEMPRALIRAWFRECEYERSGSFHFIFLKQGGRKNKNPKDDGVFPFCPDPMHGYGCFYLNWVRQHFAGFLEEAFGPGKWVLKVVGQPREMREAA